MYLDRLLWVMAEGSQAETTRCKFEGFGSKNRDGKEKIGRKGKGEGERCFGLKKRRESGHRNAFVVLNLVSHFSYPLSFFMKFSTSFLWRY